MILDSPISGVQISGIAVGYCNNEKEVQTLRESTTNASGWAFWTQEKFGNYYLSFSEFGQNWNITLPTSPLALTLATYQLVSADLNVLICYDGDLGRCQSQTTTTIVNTNTSSHTTYPANTFVSNSSESLISNNLTCVQTDLSSAGHWVVGKH